MLNENLYQLLQHNHLQGISLNSINFIIKQILEAIEQVHRMGVIHCDIKPENILLKINIEKNKSDISVKLTDFGSSCLKNNPLFTHVQSLFYRAPEVILGIPYSQAIDIWSIGLVAIELFLGGPLLPGYSEYDQLTKITKIIGKIPDNMLIRNGKKISNFYHYDKDKNIYILREPNEGEIFDDKENIYNNDFKIPFNISGLDDLLTMKRGSKIKGVEMNNSQSSTELISFIHFLKCMITILPEKRWTASQLLNHPFITGEKFDFGETDDEKHLFYDVFSKRYFTATFSDVLLAELHTNRNFALGGEVSVKTFYDFLGLDTPDEMKGLYWFVCDGYQFVDFGHSKHYIDDGVEREPVECWSIEMIFEPTLECPDDW